MRSLIVATAATALISGVHALTLETSASGNGYIKYSSVKGYFLQDEPSTNATTFDYTKHNFGLINRNYPGSKGKSAGLTQWQKFKKQVESLNDAAPSDTVYKVLFMGRHGEGYHNAAEDHYGTPAWNCYYAMLNGNATTIWHDAHLDAAGIAQAQVAHDYWQHEFEVQKTPYPQSYYTSPLTRCLQTANITFSGLDLPAQYPFVPTVKEDLREHISIHTCDHRKSKAYIQNSFPSWKIEKGFSENDELWDGVTAETNDANNARSKDWLDDIFTTDTNTWISVTSHSGEIASTLSVLGHQEFALNTGAVIPVLVKAQFLPAKDKPSPTAWHWTVSTHCAAVPKTSKENLSQGCVCTGKAGPVTTPLVKVTNTNTAGPTTYPALGHLRGL